MSIPDSEAELAELFRQLGAKRPDSWAHSQAIEGIPQLARFVFLKQAWERLLDDTDTSWIGRAIERSRRDPNEPYAGLGAALQRALALGVAQEDLKEIGRCLQAQALFSVAYLLDGPAYPPKGLAELDWKLFQVDEEGHPCGRAITGLHESVLETDPSGREMRPAKLP